MRLLRISLDREVYHPFSSCQALLKTFYPSSELLSASSFFLTSVALNKPRIIQPYSPPSTTFLHFFYIHPLPFPSLPLTHCYLSPFPKLPNPPNRQNHRLCRHIARFLYVYSDTTGHKKGAASTAPLGSTTYDVMFRPSVSRVFHPRFYSQCTWSR